MLEIIGKIWKNKIFVVFAILIVITFPSTLYPQSDQDKTIVTSSIGIDEKDGKYDVTILAVIPKDGGDVSSNLELFNGTGKTISEALDDISLDIGKKIGLSHCDCIIFSEKLMQNNLAEVLDYFIRTANLSTNPTLIATPNSASDLLDAVKSSNNLLDLSLKNIITSQEYISVIDNVTLDRFYRAYLSPHSTFTIPILKTEDSKSSSEGNKSGASSTTGNASAEDSSGGGSGGSNQQQSKKISNDNKIAILKDGKYVGTLTDDEMFIYSLISKPSEYQKFIIEEVNDENVLDSTIVFQEADKVIIPICKFVDGKPVMEYNIWLSVMLDEVKGNNHSYSSVSGIKNYLTDVVEKKFRDQIDVKLQNTNALMRKNQYDIMNVYSKFNAFAYSKFHDYANSLGDSCQYMKDMTISINLKLNYVI